MQKNTTTLKTRTGQFQWINITNANKAEISYLRRKYKFSTIDLNDCYSSSYAQRPKYFVRNSYAFLILQFPVYRTKNRTIRAEEIDFFIGSDYVITIHKNNLPPLVELFNLCSSDEFYREQYLNGTNASLVYEIVNRLQEYCYPMLDHISLDIKNIEENIFSGRERKMVNEILYIKRNVLNFRKIMQAHKNVIKKVMGDGAPYFFMIDMKIYYGNLIEHTKNIWDILTGHKEMIEALEDTNTTLVSFKLNDIMRTLTVFSVIVFPLSLLAAIFGMNTVGGMPFIDSTQGFWAIIAIMFVGSLLMYAFFRHKRWI